MAARGVAIESWAPFAEGRSDLFTNDVLARIGSAYGKSVGQVVLRWLIQRGVIVIPKTVRPERMAENFDVFDFSLSEGDLAQIAALDTGETVFFSHRDPVWVERLGGHRTTD